MNAPLLPRLIAAIIQAQNRPEPVKTFFHKLDMTGLRYGKMLVLREATAEDGIELKKDARWLCKCDCGVQKIVRGNNLRSGKTTSCGCSRKSKKGGA